MDPLWSRLPLPLRIAGFKVLEQLSNVRQHGLRGPRSVRPAQAQAAARSVWIFVSTIGELNAIEPFITRMLEDCGRPPVTLLTDRHTYDEAYRARYPDSHIETIDGTWAHAEDLARRRPPALLLVAEIPCTLHDAPCRFPYAMVHVARRAKAPVIAVNGWLYGYPPPSRLDHVESQLFARDYLRGFDLMMAQTPDVRRALVDAGGDPTSIVVTGNIKFDAMDSLVHGFRETRLSRALARRRAAGPVIVAGSVTETADQGSILRSFAAVLQAHPGALLVLAPRHPENVERMAALAQLLTDAGIGHRLRSEHEPEQACETQVLVLDTMGELRGCYGAASLAFVGTDHNVLEPLSFGCPVFVSGNWEPTYPSYPVYAQLRDAGAIESVGQTADLGPAWLRALQGQAGSDASRADGIGALLAPMRGAVERCMLHMRSHPALGPLFQHSSQT